MYRLRAAARAAPRPQPPTASSAIRHLSLRPPLCFAADRPPAPSPRPHPHPQAQPAEPLAPRTHTLEHEPSYDEQPAAAADGTRPAPAVEPSTNLAPQLEHHQASNAGALAPASPPPSSLAASLVARFKRRYERPPLTLTRGPHQDADLPVLHDSRRALAAFEVKRDATIWGRALGTGLGVAIGCWVAFFAYCEMVGLGAPASLWETDAGSGGDDAWGWALENDDWSGGLDGGTDAGMPLEARRMLHFAWFALYWPLGPTEQDARDEIEKARLRQESGPSLFTQLRDWDLQVRSATDRYVTTFSLPAPAMAESYVRGAIETTLADHKTPVWLPPALKTPDMPLPPAALHRARIPRPANTTGIALLVRHAALLEQLGTDDALERAKTLYERVLRTVNGYEGAETLEVQLARRIGDVGRRTGDPRADEWLRWGVERVTGYRPAAVVGDALSPAEGASERSSRWQRVTSLFSSSSATPSDAAAAAPAPLGGSSQPSVAALLNLTRPADLPLSRLRALLSLVASISAAQSQPMSLAAARETQEAALEYISDALAGAALAEAPPAPPAERLHELALERYRALFSVHLAEVLFASGATDAARERTPATLLDAAFRQASAVSTHLASPSSSIASPFPPTAVDAKKHPLPAAPAAPYTSALLPSVLQQPAADLLAVSRRTAAGAANLLAFLALHQAAPEPDAAALDEAARHYAAAMTLIGPVPPAAAAPGEPSAAVVVVSSAGEEEAIEHQSDEWRQYYDGWCGVRDRRQSMAA